MSGRTELRCDLCNLIQPIENYSKRSLKDEEHTCKRCTAWTEIQEPSVCPGPLATGSRDFLEEQRSMARQMRLDETAKFFADALPAAPMVSYDGFGAMTDQQKRDLDEIMRNAGADKPRTAHGNHLAFSETSSSRADSVSNSMPPHLKEKFERMTIETGSVSSTRNSKANYGASSISSSRPRAFLRQTTAASQNTNSSARGVSSSASISTATTVRQEKEEAKKSRQVVFNAWDPTGKQVRAVKNPTVVSSPAASIRETTSVNNSESAPMPKSRTRGKNWPTAEELRTTRTQSNKKAMPHTHDQCNSDDSDY